METSPVEITRFQAAWGEQDRAHFPAISAQLMRRVFRRLQRFLERHANRIAAPFAVAARPGKIHN